jgi:MFS family permease
LRALLAVTVAAQLGIGTVTALTLAMVTGPLHGGPGGYGTAEVLAGAGLVAGSAVAGRVTARFGSRAVPAAGLTVAGALTVGFAAGRVLAAGLVLLACWWMVIGVCEVAALPLLIGSVPPGRLGRVSALFRSVNKAAAMVSVAVAGLLAAVPVPVLCAGAAAMAVAGVLAAAVLPASAKQVSPPAVPAAGTVAEGQ